MSRQGYVPVAGSERETLPGARLVGPADPDEYVEVTVVLQPAEDAHDLDRMIRSSDEGPISRDELVSRFAAADDIVARVEDFARRKGLQVLQSSSARRTVSLGGLAGQMADAFDVRLGRYEAETGTSYRGREGPVHVPEDLGDAVVAVLGLDNRPQARPHFRFSLEAATSFTPPELAGLYEFPEGMDGSGECIALIELGGGFRQRDITAYFQAIGVPVPSVTAVSVDGGQNRPTTPNSADGEVLLDIDVAGGVAPGAKLAVYFAPNTDRGFVDAVTAAVYDTVRTPSIVSISWGGAEPRWTRQSLRAFELAFRAAAAVGVTVLAAAGDDGSGDGVSDGRAHVDYPASSPFVIGCGGTHLVASGGGIEDETVWERHGATGGGVSAIFPPPDWQASADVPPSANPGSPAGRGVPDIAGDADPATGYVTRVDGLTSVAGGTSAVAPLWAGLLARINQARGGRPVGYINPLLYSAEARGATRDITQGSNGAYRARGGWDACTGWGTPKGRALAALLGGDTLADTERGVTDDREPEPPPEPPPDADDLDDARPM